MKRSNFISNHTNTSMFHPDKNTDRLQYMMLIFSHIIAILPLYLSFTKEMPLHYSFILVTQVVISILYHSFPINPLRISDWVLTTFLIILNSIYFFVAVTSLSILGKILIYALTLITTIFLIFFRRDYVRDHLLWHAFGYLVAAFVIFMVTY